MTTPDPYYAYQRRPRVCGDCQRDYHSTAGNSVRCPECAAVRKKATDEEYRLKRRVRAKSPAARRG